MKPNILVVDDRPENLVAFEQLLSTFGANVLKASSGTDALEILLCRDVALALIDVQMPEMNGYELATLMRGSDRTRDIPIIFVTADGADYGRVFKGYDVGAVDFLVKPIEPRWLENKVRTFLRLYSQTRELAAAERRLQGMLETVRTSEERFRLALSSAPAVLFGQDLDLRYTWVYNSSAAPRSEDLVGLTDFELYPAHEAQALTDFKRRVIERGETGRRTLSLTLNGEKRHYDFTAEPRRSADGQVVGITCAAWDVTDRVCAELAVRASEQYLRAMADSMPQLVWTSDERGVIADFNSRLREYAPVEVVLDKGWDWLTLIHPDDVDYTVGAWNEALETGEDYACEHRMKMADGSYRWHLSRARLVRGREGMSGKWFGTSTDIHERKRAELLRQKNEARLAEALAAAEKAIAARDQVVSIVSHDLRGPLSVMRTGLAVLRQSIEVRLGDVQDCTSSLVHVDRQVTKMSKLLDELLDVAQLQAGQALTLERKPTDLVELARELTQEHARGRSGYTIELRVSTPKLVGDWDPQRLEQVVHNLLANAIKYSTPGSSIVVQLDRAANEGEWAMLQVTDEGVGIPEDERDRIFEWFARGRNVDGRVPGTGIGLAGARQIVEQHGGSIHVESQEGVGSTFIVRLPTRVDRHDARPACSTTNSDASPRA